MDGSRNIKHLEDILVNRYGICGKNSKDNRNQFESK